MDQKGQKQSLLLQRINKRFEQQLKSNQYFADFSKGMNNEHESQIIQVSLMRWISLLCKKNLVSLQQLSTGELYIQLMSQVSQFKFIRPLKNMDYHTQQSQNLVNRISTMKIIGDSILRHYQTYLMRDISGMRIDYVQLCMGNRSQGIKLFSLVIGIINQNENSDQCRKLFQAIQNLQPEDQDIIKALLQNSRNIGQSIIKHDDSPLLQKRMLTKLQIYQEKIQNLQLQLQVIKEKFQEEKLSNQFLLNQIKQLKTQKFKLIQKAQVLQLLNTRLESQNSSYILQNQNIIKKLQSQKRHYDTMLTKNQQTLLSYEKQMSVVNLMKQKIEELKSANNQLKQLLNQTLKEQHQKEYTFSLMKQNYKVLNESYIKTKEKLSQIELQFQNFKFQKDQSNWKLLASPAYHISNNSQMSSINYRVRDKLGSIIKAELSQVQMVNSNLVQKDSSGKTNLNVQQDLLSSHLQNFSHFAFNSIAKNYNLQDIQDVSEFEPNRINEQQLDKSILIDQNEQYEILIKKQQKSQIRQNCKKQSIDERNLMIGLYADLYSQNQRLRKQLEKYKEVAIKKQYRHQLFKEKLSKIRQIDPISQINLKLETQKQNINQNRFPITEKLSQNQKNISKNSPQDSSQRYHYYPLVLN